MDPSNASLARPPSAGLLEAPLWRREPYRVLFPLGGLLAWAGVLPWLLLAVRATDEYRSIFHSMAQIQSFLTCYAVGFLFTFVPRRTGTAPPAPWQMAVAIAAPVLTTVLAYLEQIALAQLSWMVLIGVVLGFILRRARSGGGARRVSPGFVWVPFSLMASVVGAVVTGVAAARGEMWLHDLGRGVLLQGLFTGLALGVGSLLFPVLTRGEPPPPLSTQQLRRAQGLHLFAAALFFASFPLEGLSVRLGFALRAAVAAAVLAGPAGLLRRPRLPGLHRRLLMVAAWCIPLGSALAALLPGYRQVGLHVTFIGGLGLLTFTVSAHVALSHGGRSDLLAGSPRPLGVMAALLGVALIARALLVFDPVRFYLWLGIAAFSFLAATLAWATLVVQALRPPTRAPSHVFASRPA